MVLFLGTMFVPTNDRGAAGGGFTHKEGGVVAIRAGNLGTLVNRVGRSGRAPEWTLGDEHVPQVLQYNGAVSARRYKQILGDDKLEYMAVYEFASEEVFRRFMASEHLKILIKEYDAHFGGVSERARSAYVQVWP